MKAPALIALTVALVVSLTAPAAASAQVDPVQMASAACATEAKQLGKKGFRKRYGRKPRPKCIRRAAEAVSGAVAVSVSDCQLELDVFGLEEFLDEYGATYEAALDECIREGVDFELDGYFPLISTGFVG